MTQLCTSSSCLFANITRCTHTALPITYCASVAHCLRRGGLAKLEEPHLWRPLQGTAHRVFVLQEAFTPTHSLMHATGSEAAYENINATGVGEVDCRSMNDAFVMRKWFLYQRCVEDKMPGTRGFTKAKPLPDGTCLSTCGMGMSCVLAATIRECLGIHCTPTLDRRLNGAKTERWTGARMAHRSRMHSALASRFASSSSILFAPHHR